MHYLKKLVKKFAVASQKMLCADGSFCVIFKDDSILRNCLVLFGKDYKYSVSLLIFVMYMYTKH